MFYFHNIHSKSLIMKFFKKHRKIFNRAEICAVIVFVAVLLFAGCGNRTATEDGIAETGAETEVETETEAEISNAASGLVIVIDPGHGFGDVGNQSGYTSYDEKYYTVIYAQEIKEKLEAYGAVVFLTHDGETYPDEDELTEKIAEYGIKYSSADVVATAGDNLFNKYERVMYTSILDHEYGVDLFLSVHFNAYDNDELYGTAIYYYSGNPYADVCQQFGDEVMSRVGYTVSYSGVHADSYEEAYAVVKYADCAAVLIECAFMTNPSDAANIESETWRDEMTTYIVESILAALGAED